MAYELSGSIEAGNVTSTFVQARDNTQTFGGSISPDGTKIAVRSDRHGGATEIDRGIDIWHSGSSGWFEADSIDIDSGAIPDVIYWFSNSEILFLAHDELKSFTSSSSGWSSNYSTSLGGGFSPAHMWVSPGRTVIGLAEDINWFPTTAASNAFMQQTRKVKLVHSSSAGFTSIKTIDSNLGVGQPFKEGRVTAMTWPDEENVLIGQPYRDDGAGRVLHFRSGSDDYTFVRHTVGHNTSNSFKNFGTFLYWHSASNSGIYGASKANEGDFMVLNLIPSQSDGYLASNFSNLVGETFITSSMLLRSDGVKPHHIDGTTINVDRSNPDRIVATSIAKSNDVHKDNRVHFSIESGSEGWKIKQINADGDGVGGMNDNNFNPSMLASGASRFVTFKSGSGATPGSPPLNGFTVFDLGLPNQGGGGGGGGGGDPASFALSQSATPLTLEEEGASGTVGVVLGKQPTSDVVISIALDESLTGRASLNVSTLTFTNANWNTQQDVTVTAVSDDIDNDNVTGDITFSIVDAESDDDFDALDDKTVPLTVQDNDTAGFTLSANSITLANEADPVSMTVRLNAKPTNNVIIDTIFGGGISDRVERNPTQLTFTDANWNVEQTITFQGNQGVDGLVNGDASGTVKFLVEATSPATEYLSVADQQIPIEIFDDDEYNFVLTKSPSSFEFAEGNSGTITVELKARPTSGNVVFDITTTGDAFTTGRASLSATSLTFPAASWDTPQTITVNTQSDEIDNDNASGVITFTVRQADTPDTGFHLSPQEVNLTVVDDDTRGLNFAPGTSLSTTEAGSSTTLTITLNSEPTSQVTVTCTPPDSTEGTMSPDPVSLIFNASNYTEGQTITFTGKEDNEVDGNQSYTVTVSATSADAKYDGQSQVITIVNVDSAKSEGDTSGKDTPSGDNFNPGGTGIPPVPPGGNTRRAPKMVTQGDFLPKKLHFEPSTIETIDKSVLNYFKKLNLFSNTNEGWKEVPVIWGTAERAYQVKHNKDIRDAQGMLKLPIISIRRVSVSKDMASKGVFQGNISEINDEQGGSVQVSRVIYQEKTRKFASADALRLYNQSHYPRPNPKIVYRTVVAPMPVNVTIMYEITLRTEYQQQMNNLILPFVTNPGTINYIRLFEGEHRYEAFIQGEFQNGDNLADFSSDERKFETKIQLKVIGYLIGQEDNREKPHYSVRENAVEVKIPRERISLNEVPPHEFGAYYGLSGVKDPLLLSGFPAPFFFSNVPAVGDAGAGGGGGGGDVSGNLVTTTNFATIMSQNLVIREALKDPTDPLPSDKRTFTLSTGNMANNTETVYLNGVLQEVGAGKDYTVTGNNVIVFTQDLDSNDSVFITYIKS